jgi:hypothetical protein
VSDNRPYADRAREITIRHQKGEDHIAAAAIMLKELYGQYRGDQVKRMSWEQFASENFPWSPRYVYKLIEIGRAPDPAAALRKWREASLHRSKAAREKAYDKLVKPEVRTSPGTAEDVWRRYYALSPREKARFDTWWRQQAAEYQEAA